MQSPPCSRMAVASLDALASLRVVSTVKKPSCANFCATAPPTPHRTPTGSSLSSTGLPCASRVLRPSDCHLEVAPITTATCLPLVFVVMRNFLLVCRFGFAVQDTFPSSRPTGLACGRPEDGLRPGPIPMASAMFYVCMLAGKLYGVLYAGTTSDLDPGRIRVCSAGGDGQDDAARHPHGRDRSVEAPARSRRSRPRHAPAGSKYPAGRIGGSTAALLPRSHYILPAVASAEAGCGPSRASRCLWRRRRNRGARCQSIPVQPFCRSGADLI